MAKNPLVQSALLRSGPWVPQVPVQAALDRHRETRPDPRGASRPDTSEVKAFDLSWIPHLNPQAARRAPGDAARARFSPAGDCPHCGDRSTVAGDGTFVELPLELARMALLWDRFEVELRLRYMADIGEPAPLWNDLVDTEESFAQQVSDWELRSQQVWELEAHEALGRTDLVAAAWGAATGTVTVQEAETFSRSVRRYRCPGCGGFFASGLAT